MHAVTSSFFLKFCWFWQQKTFTEISKILRDYTISITSETTYDCEIPNLDIVSRFVQI